MKEAIKFSVAGPPSFWSAHEIALKRELPAIDHRASSAHRSDCLIRSRVHSSVLPLGPKPLRLYSAIPENRSFFGRFFSLTTACFFVRSLVSFLSDAGDVGDAGVWWRLRRAMSWREIPFRLASWREFPFRRRLGVSSLSDSVLA
jgi:hypothetical protein